MKNKLMLLSLFAAIGLFACKSETAPATETPAATEATAPAADAAAADAIDIKVPAEFLVEINEKNEVKVMGESIAPTDFEKKITEYFEGYRAMGSKTMPPLKIQIEGTVTMGVRNEFETMYNETKTKFENLH